MEPQLVLDNLTRTTGALKAAILNCEEAAEELTRGKRELEKARRAAKQAGKIDGKNESEREMQYAEFCTGEYDFVAEAEKTERRTRDTIELCRLDYDLARYMLRIAELSK